MTKNPARNAPFVWLARALLSLHLPVQRLLDRLVQGLTPSLMQPMPQTQTLPLVQPLPGQARKLLVWLVVGVALGLGGCASVYVDGGTPEVPAAQFKKPAKPDPVQLFFEFQTKGVANARATEQLRARVADQIKASGLFSAVGEQPAAGGATLSITLNNVPLTDDAFTKGFVAGLTFGLAGQQVSDGYVCTARYRASEGSAPVVKQARHALHTSIGAAGPPPNASKAASIDEAVTLMTRQVLSAVLNELAREANP